MTADGPYGGLQSPGGGYADYHQQSGSSGGTSGGSGAQSSAQPAPPDDPWSKTPDVSGQPAIALEIAIKVTNLRLSVALGQLKATAASKAFREFLLQTVYSNQRGQGNVGFCAAASKQMLLKFGDIIKLGLSYQTIKTGLRNETSANAQRPGQWEYWHFNETVKENERPVFSHPTKLGTDAILQVAANGQVGTGRNARLKLRRLNRAEAVDFLNRGALIAVGTPSHWLTAIRDPFANTYVFLDPYASQASDRLFQSKSLSSVGQWGSASDYNALVHE